MTDAMQLADKNLEDRLRNATYPGRGLVLGTHESGRTLVQVYWIMGRSENSRNRVFVADGVELRTEPADAHKCKDPSLIIYNAMRELDGVCIVTNGDQTDTICEALRSGGTFESALDTRRFEPDAPNFTPRVSGLVDLADERDAYKLGILKTIGNDADRPVRQYFNYETAVPGIGHTIATYSGDGSPLPAFDGEPQPMPIPDDLDATLDLYWSALNADNKVSLLVKHINRATNESEVRIANKNQA